MWELVTACPEVKNNKYLNHSLPTCKRGWWKSYVDRVLKFKSINTGVVKDNPMELETDGYYMIELSVIAKEKYEFILIDMNSKSNIKHEVRRRYYKQLIPGYSVS